MKLEFSQQFERSSNTKLLENPSNEIEQTDMTKLTAVCIFAKETKNDSGT
jgi:hypothetical protein